MANLFDVFNEGKSVEHTEGGKLESGETPVTISGLKPSTTYDKIQVAYAGQDKKTDVPSFTTAKPAPVLMKSFSLNKNEITGKVGDVVKVNVYDVLPDNATEKGINVSSSDKTIATAVDNLDGSYSVTLVKEGTATVHWVAVDGGGAKKDLTVTVTPEAAPPAE